MQMAYEGEMVFPWVISISSLEHDIEDNIFKI